MLLINPRKSIWLTYAPQGILYLAAVLEREGIPVTIIDLNLSSDRHFKKLLRQHLHEGEPIGISVNTGTLRSAMAITEYFRKEHPSHTIFWGGPLATSAPPERILKHADYCVQGEGEPIIASIAQGQDPRTIPGVLYQQDGTIQGLARLPFVEDLDALPFPAWHKVPYLQYSFPGRKPFAGIFTSRGCPSPCKYCTKHVHGLRIRTRSIESVMEEIDYLVQRFAVRDIHFWDDNFTFYPERVIAICEQILKKGLEKKLHFSVPGGVRGDIPHEAMFQLMGRCNFDYVGVGIESADQDLLNRMGKNCDLSKVPATVSMVKKNGIRVGLQFMLGLPYETEETMQKTINLAKKLDGEYVCFSLAVPIPGTELWDIVEREGRFLTDPYQGFPLYEHGEPIFEMPHLPAATVRRYFKKAHRSVYWRPKQMLRSFTGLVRHFNFYHFTYFMKNAGNVLFRGKRM